MIANYDTIAKQYQQFHQSPQSRYIDVYTYFNLLGELAGKSILDLGCGEGFYTRKFQRQGATKVVGVYISPEMIFLARQEELREPLGIEYLVADVGEMGFIEHFDLVVASKFSLTDYYLSKETYEWAFRTAGFSEIRWHSPRVSAEGIEKLGLEFWQDFLDYQPMIAIECIKAER
jgi:SAM-dependent methyltransferase